LKIALGSAVGQPQLMNAVNVVVTVLLMVLVTVMET
jgi:hypothetical protein